MQKMTPKQARNMLIDACRTYSTHKQKQLDGLKSMADQYFYRFDWDDTGVYRPSISFGFNPWMESAVYGWIEDILWMSGKSSNWKADDLLAFCTDDFSFEIEAMKDGEPLHNRRYYAKNTFFVEIDEDKGRTCKYKFKNSNKEIHEGNIHKKELFQDSNNSPITIEELKYSQRHILNLLSNRGQTNLAPIPMIYKVQDDRSFFWDKDAVIEPPDHGDPHTILFNLNALICMLRKVMIEKYREKNFDQRLADYRAAKSPLYLPLKKEDGMGIQIYKKMQEFKTLITFISEQPSYKNNSPIKSLVSSLDEAERNIEAYVKWKIADELLNTSIGFWVEGYDLSLLPEEDEELERNIIYIQIDPNDENSFKYKVKDLQGELQEGEINAQEIDIKGPLTIEKLDSKIEKILDITAKRGHTQSRDQQAIKQIEAQLAQDHVLDILRKNHQSSLEQNAKLLAVISILIGVGIFLTLGLIFKRLYDSNGSSINFFKPLSLNLYEDITEISAKMQI